MTGVDCDLFIMFSEFMGEKHGKRLAAPEEAFNEMIRHLGKAEKAFCRLKKMEQKKRSRT